MVDISNNANAGLKFFMAAHGCTRTVLPGKSQLMWELARSQSTMTLDQVGLQSRKSLTQSTKSRLRSCVMASHFPLKVITIWSLMHTSQMSMCHRSRTLNGLNIDWAELIWRVGLCIRADWAVSMWAPVKKQNNNIYLSGNKKISVKICDKTVDLTETKGLYGRLMVLTRWHWPDIIKLSGTTSSH